MSEGLIVALVLAAVAALALTVEMSEARHWRSVYLDQRKRYQQRQLLRWHEQARRAVRAVSGNRPPSLMGYGLALLLALAAPALADGPYQEPKKPKAKRIAAPAPAPAPTPSPTPVPYDGAQDFTAPPEAFEAPMPTPTPEPVPIPEPTPEPPSVSVVAAIGGVVSMGGATDSSLQPMALVLADIPVSDAQMGPHVVTDLMLGALPGEAISLSDPTTFKTLTFRALLAQPLSKRLRFTPYVGIGFTTRLGTETEPLQRTARWWSAGIRFAGKAGLLELGAGGDERLGGGYAPTAHVRGALVMGSKGGINAYLYGEAALALALGYWPDRADWVTVGVGAGR